MVCLQYRATVIDCQKYKKKSHGRYIGNIQKHNYYLLEILRAGHQMLCRRHVRYNYFI